MILKIKNKSKDHIISKVKMTTMDTARLVAVVGITGTIIAVSIGITAYMARSRNRHRHE